MEPRATNMRKKPWNRADCPVYSIATYHTDGTFNMNICTYATAVSMHPKLFSVAIYKQTKTLENVCETNEFVLQLMSIEDISKVRLLGKQSGFKVDKMKRLKQEHLPYLHFQVLPGALAYIHLKVLQQIETGDHHTFICEVLHYKNNLPGTSLMLSHLSEAGIISV